ncbi:MAG: uroporphyrinogen decarboxylase [Nitrospirota bacterium]|jgi:uroporphyrinogen decarboxylase
MNDTFLKACRGESASHTPVWLMRQAGRYMKEYQEVRRKHDFWTMCKTPELAAEVTLQPVDILGVDAAILFSDILTVLEPMGQNVEFVEGRGPVVEGPVRDRQRAEALRVADGDRDLGYVMEAVRLLRRKLEGRVPLIGFSGAPFTLATYMVEGGSSKNFMHTKTMMYRDPALFCYLLDKITDTVISYLKAQIRAGAQAVQIFDSWAGALAPDDFRDFELPRIKRIVRTLKEADEAPVIYFANGAAGLLDELNETGADVIGVDWRVDIGRAAGALGKDHALQGNLDPLALFLPEDGLREKTGAILEKAAPAKGHIFNLGHGIIPQTPVESAKALVRAVHELSSRA